jgi:hypothetical protein
MDAQLGVDAHLQLVEMDWFGDVVVGPRLQTADSILEVGLGGNQDDGQSACSRALTDGSDDTGAVQAGHRTVEQDEGDGIAFEHLQRGGAVNGLACRIAGVLQDAHEEFSHCPLVVDDQDEVRRRFADRVGGSWRHACLSSARRTARPSESGLQCHAHCLAADDLFHRRLTAEHLTIC